MGLYPLFHLGLKQFFLRHYDFFSFIDLPNVLESAHKWVQIDNEIVLEPPGSLPGTQKSERGPRCSWCGSRSVM